MYDHDTGRGGFSLIEVLIAIVILSVGLLAMAATTAFLSRQIQVAELQTERAAAVRYTAEAVRALTPTLVCKQEGTEIVDPFTVAWYVDCPNSTTFRVRLISDGPGYIAGSGWVQGVADTTYVTLSDFQ